MKLLVGAKADPFQPNNKVKTERFDGTLIFVCAQSNTALHFAFENKHEVIVVHGGGVMRLNDAHAQNPNLATAFSCIIPLIVPLIIPHKCVQLVTRLVP